MTGEEGICKGCGIATLSISYYDLGVTTGKMAVKILDRRGRYFRNAHRVLPEPRQEVHGLPLRALGIEIPGRLRPSRSNP